MHASFAYVSRPCTLAFFSGRVACRQQLKLQQDVSELQRDMKQQATDSAAQLRDVEAKLQQDVRAWIVCFAILRKYKCTLLIVLA